MMYACTLRDGRWAPWRHAETRIVDEGVGGAAIERAKERKFSRRNPQRLAPGIGEAVRSHLLPAVLGTAAPLGEIACAEHHAAPIEAFFATTPSALRALLAEKPEYFALQFDPRFHGPRGTCSHVSLRHIQWCFSPRGRFEDLPSATSYSVSCI